jgi:hypothetical protein
MGLVGALIRQAFAGFQCPRCGPIPREEFPPEVQSQMTMGSVAYVAAAVGVFALVIGFIIWINSQ